MRLGGRSSNNGIVFDGEKYTARFIMAKDLKYNIEIKKKSDLKGIEEKLRSIPIVKSIYSLLSLHRFSIILVILIILADILPSSGESGGMYPVVLLITITTAVFMVSLLIYVIKTIFYKIKNTWMYHGAEHKTIYAALNNIDLTLMNVKKCPRIAKRCGTNLVVFLVLFYIILCFLTPYISIRYFCSYILAYELFDLDKGDEYPVIRLFFKFGYWCQQKIFTREPTDFQLEAAVDTMKKLLEAEGAGM